MRGDEERVLAAFCEWLEADRWEVTREVVFADAKATRDGETLYVEAKGRTSSVGLDVDTLYGQLLRRMPFMDDPTVRFTVVVPVTAKAAALRVQPRVRRLLRIDVYTVSELGDVARAE